MTAVSFIPSANKPLEGVKQEQTKSKDGLKKFGENH